jgi:hypothetical protein
VAQSRWLRIQSANRVFRLTLTKNYENMKMLVDRWIDLATELSNLRLKRDRT